MNPLTDPDYMPDGGTALYDAIAEGVRLADKDKTEEERVVCVIMTDGEENSSKETTMQQVKDIISGHEAKGDWTFIYIGENPERWSEETGICCSNVMNWNQPNTLENFENVNYMVSRCRGNAIGPSRMRRSMRQIRSLCSLS